MAFRTRYRRKAPSSPEIQGLFFNKVQANSAFFDPSHAVVQRQESTIASTKPEEEKPVQKQDKMDEENPIQKQAEEEEPSVQKQDKMDEEKPVQKQVEEEKPVQKQDNHTHQEQAQIKGSTYHPSTRSDEPQEPTSLPTHLKTGIEALSGISMDDVKVHYNSPKPIQMQALAYTQGTHIYLAPGQEKHLPHEVWHVVQQKQGRVMPTVQAKGVDVNDDPGLEQEATVMGQKAGEHSSNTI